MEGMTAGMAAPRLAAWSPLDWILMLLMWAVMMVGMMLPSATPTILLFAAVRRKQSARGHDIAPVPAFVIGYLTAWTGFSVAAVVLQWGLERLALLTPMMAAAGNSFGGAVLITAGLYQLSPLKHRCLEHCRSPIEFLSKRWRPGVTGAVGMGLEHGTYCVGCCWVLMALLFVGGVMNLLWVAAIAGFVLVEKIAPRGNIVRRVAALLLIAWGIYTLA
jgi:predicted metal-binding membrane protein